MKWPQAVNMMMNRSLIQAPHISLVVLVCRRVESVGACVCVFYEGGGVTWENRFRRELKFT